MEAIKTIPRYKRNDLISISGEVNSSGIEKRVIPVLLGDSRVMLKVLRAYERETEHHRSLENRHQEIQELYNFLSRIYAIDPYIVPRPIGTYSHNRIQGLLVEEVIGYNIEDIKGNNIVLPTREQVRIFTERVNKLSNNGIFFDSDALGPYNLMLGHTESNPQDRIMMIDLSEAPYTKITSQQHKTDLQTLESLSITHK